MALGFEHEHFKRRLVQNKHDGLEILLKFMDLRQF